MSLRFTGYRLFGQNQIRPGQADYPPDPVFVFETNVRGPTV